MSKRLAAGVAALLLTGVLGAGAASAAPTPEYTIACDASGVTAVSWAKAKLDHIDFQWKDAAGVEVGSQPGVPLPPHPPHGSTMTGAGADTGAATVQVTFARADGMSDILVADCK